MVAAAYQDRRSLNLVSTAEGTASATTELTQGSTGDLDPVVAPRGDRLAFSSTRSGNRHIWTSRLDGTDARELTTGDAVDERPTWSPDSSTIGFVSSRGTSRAIWLVGADGSGVRKVIEAQVIDSITWSPDGSELAYSVPVRRAARTLQSAREWRPACSRCNSRGSHVAKLVRLAKPDRLHFLGSSRWKCSASGRAWLRDA
jgi:Tol biopolymer transport system component